jgi:hypothetical protein
MAYNTISDGYHPFQVVEVAGIKYGLALKKMDADGTSVYFILVKKGDTWNTDANTDIVAQILLDNADQSVDPYTYVWGKVNEVNQQLATYFGGDNVPVTWTDKLEDALRHMVLLLTGNIPKIDKVA